MKPRHPQWDHVATYEHTIRARGVSLEEAYEWWTDYSEDDHTGPLWEDFGEGTRTVLEKDDDGAKLHDTFDGHDLIYDITFDRPDRIELHGHALGTDFDAELLFEETEEGVAITGRGSVEPQHLLARLTSPLWMGRVLDTIKRDLDLHAVEMERELAKDE